jgi:Zn-dependent oligopeptidase
MIPDEILLADIPSKIKRQIAVDKYFSFSLNVFTRFDMLNSHHQGFSKSMQRFNPSKGPWMITLNDHVFESFMKYSGNRNLRKALYEGFYSRASYVNEQYDTNNSTSIKEIIRIRFAKFDL